MYQTGEFYMEVLMALLTSWEENVRKGLEKNRDSWSVEEYLKNNKPDVLIHDIERDLEKIPKKYSGLLSFGPTKKHYGGPGPLCNDLHEKLEKFGFKGNRNTGYYRNGITLEFYTEGIHHINSDKELPTELCLVSSDKPIADIAKMFYSNIHIYQMFR